MGGTVIGPDDSWRFPAWKFTKMAEAGTPEHTMLAIAGYMSRAMLERYSHIRMTAKREAVQSLRTVKDAHRENGVGTVETDRGLRRLK